MKNVQLGDPQYNVLFTDDEEIHGDAKLVVSGPPASKFKGGLLGNLAGSLENRNSNARATVR